MPTTANANQQKIMTHAAVESARIDAPSETSMFVIDGMWLSSRSGGRAARAEQAQLVGRRRVLGRVGAMKYRRDRDADHEAVVHVPERAQKAVRANHTSATRSTTPRPRRP